MALTAESVQRLGNVSLINFFNKDNKNKRLYMAKAERAYEYATNCMGTSGQTVRVDDVAAPLVLALKVGDPLSAYLAASKLSQGYWYRMFADYVLDQVWEELVK